MFGYHVYVILTHSPLLLGELQLRLQGASTEEGTKACNYRLRLSRQYECWLRGRISIPHGAFHIRIILSSDPRRQEYNSHSCSASSHRFMVL
jgi:hypothetical protein